MRELFYTKTLQNVTLECFKLSDADELTEYAYEIRMTNVITKETDFVTAATPQSAIALADYLCANNQTLPQ